MAWSENAEVLSTPRQISLHNIYIHWHSILPKESVNNVLSWFRILINVRTYSQNIKISVYNTLHVCIIDTLHKQGGKADLHHECYRVPLHCVCMHLFNSGNMAHTNITQTNHAELGLLLQRLTVVN